MTQNTRKNIIIFIIAFALMSAAIVVHGQTIGTLDQFVATTTPSTSITQRSFGRAIKVTGLTAGQFLKLDSNNIMTTGAVSITGAGIDNFNPLVTLLGGTSTLANIQSASTTLYVNVGGVTSPVFTATSTGSYFIAGSIPLSTFGGSQDYCIGELSCSHITSALNTIAIGQDALTSVTSLSGNVGIGKNSLFFTTGAGNTAVGFASGVTNGTGTGNTFVGFGADATANTYSDSIAIGENALVAGSNHAIIGGEIGTGDEVNLGIGTSSPGTILSIGDFESIGNGAINFDLGTSTFATPGGINIKKGCYAIAGVCVGGSGGSGSGTVNSGVAGQIAFYNSNGTAVSGTSTITIGTTSPISGNVGIGTVIPTVKLQVVGGEIVLSDGAVTGTVGNGNFSITGSLGSFNVFKRGVTNLASTVAGDRWAQYADASGFHTFTGTTGDTNIITPGGNWVLNFKEGIGGVTPNTPLDIAGTTTIRTIDALATTYATREAGLLFARSDVPTTFTNAITNSINGTPASQTMNFEVGNGANTRVTAMTLTGGGNVGIGNTAPPDLFSVEAASGGEVMQFRGDSSAQTYLGFYSSATRRGYIGTGGGNIDLVFNSDNDFYIGDGSGNAVFYGQNSTGNVGLGTLSPTGKLHVSSSANTYPEFKAESSSSDTYSSWKNTGSGGREYWLDSGSSGAGIGSGNFAIYDATAGASRLTINSSGFVGIGSSTPQAELSVQAPAGCATDPFRISSSSPAGGVLLSVNCNGMVIHTDPLNTRVPPISMSTGAGTGPTYTFSGEDDGGIVTISNTGTSPAGSASTIFTITYLRSCPTGSTVTISPANALTAALPAANQVWVSPSAGSFAVISGSSALTAGTAYAWTWTRGSCW